ncbi:UDP-N-acetylmuramoyl-tripeptide--D-alanyl-D-alanine ligase [Flavobacterium sp.]|jgi:UDP-N-acetylmuramoyl-tripeptide--D-alanyl-D-alanine ligase|uniref:UDP-N-acetylmuramoyl-tripeptide--D-alanyl-D- alanine ligase n=1 Tax=Flavobacterium sp. TaxID=239 RepID=UPI002A82BDFA|nr:UDP-N-acetylmuramoyl-tripeptide--D-alanyl-D-alanine ligase [Flavobacterium sp.]
MKMKNLYIKFLECSAVSTDTRKIEQNSIFFALKGDNFDANSFTKEALEKGAKYVVIDNPKYHIKEKTILVDNVLITLQELANYHRRILKTPIVGLTGSNGKTTTKELINAVLSTKFNTVATIGNLNNHIGVPLTLLRFNEETEIGIVEMGANHQKEIEFLCQIAEPNFGYITNFGKAHLEGFGGVEGIIKGKSELYNYLKENNQIAIVNLDDSLQEKKTENIKRFTFSNTNINTNVYIKSIEANPMVKVEFNNTNISSNLIGTYNANNINAAITIAKYFKIEDSIIKSAIENYIPTNNRSQLIDKNSNKIILDAYNANPSSMAAAITNFIQIDKPSKVVILGDMFELGHESLTEHRSIINLLKNEENITSHFVGKDFYSNKENYSHIHFHQNFEELSNYLKENNLKNSFLLIKGSRGMALERVLEII